MVPVDQPEAPAPARSNMRRLIWIIVLLGVVLIVGYLYWQSLPVPQTNYYGVNLQTDAKAEVQYKLGVPESVLGEPVNENGQQWARVYILSAKDGQPNALPKGLNFESFNDWSYATTRDGSGVIVSFNKSGKVTEIRCYSMKTVRGQCQAVLGINVGDKEDEVMDRLGNPSSAAIEGLTKTMVYSTLNLRLILEKQRVYGISVGR